MSNAVADLYRRGTDDPEGHGRETTVFDAIHAKISPRSEVLRLRNRHYKQVEIEEARDDDADGVPDVYQRRDPAIGS